LDVTVKFDAGRPAGCADASSASDPAAVERARGGRRARRGRDADWHGNERQPCRKQAESYCSMQPQTLPFYLGER